MKVIFNIIVGLLAGVILTIYWDIDDKGLWLALMPGWLFSIIFLFIRLSSKKLFSIPLLISGFSWTIFTSICFFVSYLLTSTGGLPVSPIAGLFTTLAMLLWYSFFIEKIPLFVTNIVSGTSALISVIGILFFLNTESTSVLFISYYAILISVLDFQLNKTDFLIKHSLKISIVGLLASILMFYITFIILDFY